MANFFNIILKKIIVTAVLLDCVCTVYAQQPVDTERKELYAAVLKEKDLIEKEALCETYEKKYLWINNEQAQRETATLNAAMAEAFEQADSVKQYEKYAGRIGADKYAYSYFRFAKKLLSQNKYPDYAQKFAWQALKGFENTDLNKPRTGRDGKPLPMNNSFKAKMNGIYAERLDLYGYACYTNNKYKEGFSYAKKAAIDLCDDTNWVYNEHYALLLLKVLPATEVQNELERIFLKGTLNEKGQELLKMAFKKAHKSDKDYDAYFGKLKAIVDSDREKKLIQRMCIVKAPEFSLNDISGNHITQSSLLGKTVVLHFWSTWSEPSVNIFPAMKRVVDRFANDKNVVFLFINTKEMDGDKVGRVKGFMAKEAFEKYKFTLLMDSDNVANTIYGIKNVPAKFVIDPKGNIRFATEGYNNKEDEMVEELTVMINMVEKSVQQ